MTVISTKSLIPTSMKVSIITIGDEILIGQIVDTNSAFMGRALNDIGCTVEEILSIADERSAIVSALDRSRERSDVVLITGGLGPTKDDVTKEALAEYFGVKHVLNDEILLHIRTYMERKGRPLLESHRSMAMVPENCEILQNEVGTAAAMWFEFEGTIFVSMPGVPYEMKDFMNKQVLPRLSKMTKQQLLHKTLMTAGLGESIIASKIEDVENDLPRHIKLAYLPRVAGVRLRLSGQALGGDLNQEMEDIATEIKMRLGKYHYADEDTTLEAWLGEVLKSRKETLSTAESCTGGNIARILTRIPGASAFYQGSVCTYSNELKMNILGVQPETLQSHGAVSEQTVREMAMGALDLLKTDYTIAVSGVAGPTGGTKEKPVGTVWIAVAGKSGNLHAQKYMYPGSREIIIQGTSQIALNQLRKFIFGLL